MVTQRAASTTLGGAVHLRQQRSSRKPTKASENTPGHFQFSKFCWPVSKSPVRRRFGPDVRLRSCSYKRLARCHRYLPAEFVCHEKLEGRENKLFGELAIEQLFLDRNAPKISEHPNQSAAVNHASSNLELWCILLANAASRTLSDSKSIWKQLSRPPGDRIQYHIWWS